MAFQGVTFNPLSFEQANPMLSGMQAGSQVVQQQNTALGQSIANQLQSANLPYAGQLAQAGLATSQAQAPYLQSQTAVNYATLPYMGMKFAGPYMGALAQLQKAGILNANSARSFLNTPEGQAYSQNHPEVIQQIADTFKNQAAQSAGQFGVTAPPPGQSGVYTPTTFSTAGAYGATALPGGTPTTALPSQTPNANLTMTPTQVQQLGASAAPPTSNTPDAASMQGALNSALQKKTTPNSILLQRYYSQSFDQQVAPWISKLPSISNYAGLAGQAGLSVDKYAAATGGTSSPQYQDWNSFVNSASSLAGNELRRSLGVNSSVAAQQEMEELSDPSFWDEHPGDALARWNAMLAAKKANDRVITQSAGQTENTLSQQSTQPAFQYATKPGTGTSLGAGVYQVILKDGTAKTITDNDLATTAKANKMTIAQVKSALGVQ